MESTNTNNSSSKKLFLPTASAFVQDQIIELLYNPANEQTALAVWRGDRFEIGNQVKITDQRVLVPYSPQNNLIKNEVVLLPSHPEEFGSDRDLFASIRAFIHRYVDVSPLFERIASYYVLLSWVYDSFQELPYLRLRGEPGSGKTRFLLTVGALCYKPIFASGASTISPLFRILDAFRGTLIIDESDFRMSDEKAEAVKILNNGNVRGFPVLRSEPSPTTKEYNPRAYAVYGPKIIATRGLFDDRALESRFLTEDMGQDRLRQDIPINLPPAYREEARRLRNQLLMFRFRNLRKCAVQPELADRGIEPRLNQIFVPLLSVVDDEEARREIQAIAKAYHQDMLSERSLAPEAQILEIVRDSHQPDLPLTVKEITRLFQDRHQQEYDRRITPRWIGYLLRAKLRLRPHRIGGVFVLPAAELRSLPQLLERYGLTSPQRPEVPEVQESRSSAPPPQDPTSPESPAGG